MAEGGQHDNDLQDLDATVQHDDDVDGPQHRVAHNNNNQGSVNTIQIKIPPFWKADPELWFFQIEAQFTSANIRSDLSKYNQIVGKLDTDTLTAVSDIVKNPPANNKYQTLRDRLTSQFAETDRQKLKTLFNDLSLNDGKPSDLLRKMKDKSCNKVGDELLQELWCNRLSHQIQAILSCSNEPLAQQVKMADKIYDTLDHSSIQALSKKQQQLFDSDLVKKLCTLEGKIDSLQKELNKSRSRSSTPRRHRSISRSPRRPEQKPTKPCWYHKQFRDKATKCVDPCSYDMTNKNSKN